jgi:hypothetical protein
VTHRPTPPAPPRWTRFRFWAGILLAVVVVAAAVLTVAAGWRLMTVRHQARPLTLVPVSGLVPACQDVIRTWLRIPESAGFGGESVTGRKPYVLTGWVDSRTGTGTLVRHRYRCTAWRTPYAWRVDDPVFHD